jgi:hypothetical protein
MPNLLRLIVRATRGDNSTVAPPPELAALADALDKAHPRSQLDLQDAYFNSAAMHQCFKQKLEAAAGASPLLPSVQVEPAHRIAHEVDPQNPNVWTSSYGTGGGMIYAVRGTPWFLSIRFQ